MSTFDSYEARREVEQLDRLARDARREGHYATTERLLEQAVATAERLDDLPLLVKERAWLADAQRMQGKYMQAIATYTWLIGLATDPDQSRRVANEDSLWYLAGAFMDFVAAGRFLPAMPVDRLLRVITDGLTWLERVGKREWAAGLRSQRGTLLKRQGDFEGARQELEAALALERRHLNAPGYTLAVHQLNLAELLRQHFGAHAESIALVEEVLAAPSSSPNVRRWAWKELAYARLALGETAAAEQAARESLALAQQIESPPAMILSYELLGRLHREAGQMPAAVITVAQEWRWARRHGSVEDRHNALAHCACVRLFQARQACGLEPRWGDVPAQLPSTADRALALRRLRAARHFLRWAQPSAVQLDRAAGNHTYQKELDELTQTVDALTALLDQSPDP